MFQITTKIPNGLEMYQKIPFQGLSTYSEIGILGLKI
jgi:hypothetical protein